MDISDAVTSWLLDADPAIRWQVQRDVLDTAPAQWQSTRARVAREGFGAALLAEQDPEGTWAGGAFFPAGFFDSPETEAPGQPWVATTWALKDLREWGVDAAVLGDTAQRLDAGCRWDYDDLPYSNRHRYSALAALDYFREAALFDGSGLVDGRPDARLTDAVEMVRAARQPDGTWVQTAPLAGRTWFDVDVAEGEPSRWLTLFGTRVLKWWDAAA